MKERHAITTSRHLCEDGTLKETMTKAVADALTCCAGYFFSLDFVVESASVTILHMPGHGVKDHPCCPDITVFATVVATKEEKGLT